MGRARPKGDHLTAQRVCEPPARRGSRPQPRQRVTCILPPCCAGTTSTSPPGASAHGGQGGRGREIHLPRSFPHAAYACGFMLANDGHDTRAIQAYLGHRSIMSTVRYTALTPNRFKNFWKDSKWRGSLKPCRPAVKQIDQVAGSDGRLKPLACQTAALVPLTKITRTGLALSDRVHEPRYSLCPKGSLLDRPRKRRCNLCPKGSRSLMFSIRPDRAASPVPPRRPPAALPRSLSVRTQRTSGA